MGKIAHLKVNCPQCGKSTSIYVEESGGSNAKVKCEHCGAIFEFGAGMMYEPVAYVSTIPASAIITTADEKSFRQPEVKCGKCGFEYTDSDSAINESISKTASESDNPLSALLLQSPAFKNLIGVKVLYKCGSCGKIACSDCAPDSEGITKKKCPFCGVDYTIYSEIKPDGSNAGDDIMRTMVSTPEPKSEAPKPEPKRGFFKRLFGK